MERGAIRVFLDARDVAIPRRLRRVRGDRALLPPSGETPSPAAMARHRVAQDRAGVAAGLASDGHGSPRAPIAPWTYGSKGRRTGLHVSRRRSRDGLIV